MGKRSGTTKSGRVMNPADRERKMLRAKELKRNRVERVKIREAIVKGRDAQELLEHLEQLDEQEFSGSSSLASSVTGEKRAKYTRAFRQQVQLYRNEGNEAKVKELETMWQTYDLTKLRKEQHYRAVLFSEMGETDEIPLPAGAMADGAAMTPCMPPPRPPQFPPSAVGILKKDISYASTAAAKKQQQHKYPPGPPCGLPPLLYSDSERDEAAGLPSVGRDAERRVRFSSPNRISDDRRLQPRDGEGRDGGADEDYDAVEIPEHMVLHDAQPPQPEGATLASGPPPPVDPPFFPTGPYPPGFRIPPNMPPELHAQALRQGRGMDAPMLLPTPVLPAPRPSFAGALGHPPQQPAMREPLVQAHEKEGEEETPATESVISAAPQIRNLVGESTRFVPTALRVPRMQPPKPIKKPKANLSVGLEGRKTSKGAEAPSTSVDEACDEFLRELQGLL